MKKLKNFVIQKDRSILDALRLIALNNNRAVIVLDKKEVIGIVSEGDIIRALLKNKKINSPLSKIMNKSFKFLTKDNRSVALRYFKKHTVSLLPVVDKKMRVMDIITLKDIFKGSFTWVDKI